MKISPRNAAKLASLSALGAGALVASMGEADATIVFHDLSGSPGKVGFTLGFSASFSAKTASGAGFKFSTGSGFNLKTHSSHASATYQARRVIKFSGLSNSTSRVRFAANGAGLLKLFAAGAFASGNAATGRVATRSWWKRKSISRYTYMTRGFTSVGGSRIITYSARKPIYSYPTYHTANPTPGLPNPYALFTFNFHGNPYYGWVALSLVNQNVYGNGQGTGPDLTITGWAYDSEPIAAGDTGQAPEPGTFAMTGLAALVLGAAGVRRWRAARSA